MAIIKNFIYCLGTRIQTKNEEPALTVIEGVLNCLTPDFVPGNYSFSVSFSLLGLEKNEEYTVETVFINAEERELVRTDSITLNGNLEEQNKHNIPKEYFGYNLGIEFKNVIIEKEGIYTTRVYINGECQGEYRIYAKGKQTTGSNA